MQIRPSSRSSVFIDIMLSNYLPQNCQLVIAHEHIHRSGYFNFACQSAINRSNLYIFSIMSFILFNMMSVHE